MILLCRCCRSYFAVLLRNANVDADWLNCVVGLHKPVRGTGHVRSCDVRGSHINARSEAGNYSRNA